MTEASKPWTRWLLVLQALLLLLAALGPLSHNLDLLPFRPAFLAMLLGIGLAFVVAVVALLVLLWSWIKRAAHWRTYAVWAAVAGLAPVLIVITAVGPKNFSVPPIHDISTDTANPPEFVAAKRERSAEQNSLEHAGEKLAELQRQAYPEVAPMLSDLPVDRAFARSLAAVEQLGWQLLAQDPASGRIEATDETALFGFKDDIVIRVAPTAEGSRIDTRSVSRVGQSDLGANAARILRFQRAFKGE